MERTSYQNYKNFKKFALKNPKVSIIIKIKTGETPNRKEYVKLPENIKIHYFGVGHKLLKESKVVIAWNTTSILEAIAANRFVLLPYFHKKNKSLKKEDEMLLNLKKQNYGYSENNFSMKKKYSKKLDYFIKKKYDKNITYNNKYSLKHKIINKIIDNQASLRLNNFIKKNLVFR